MAAVTALERYAKLEAVGRYVGGVGAPAREVVLSFGARSLVILEMDERAIAHWPLASLMVLAEPDAETVELAPDPESAERILLDDAEMIAALTEVCADLAETSPPSPRRGRRIWPWAVGSLTLLLAAGVAMLPALPARLVAAVPSERAAELGARLESLQAGRVGGATPVPACVAAEGVAALGRLAGRLSGDGPRPAVTVLDHPGIDSLALPGGRIMLERGLLEMAATPEEVAGILAHQIARSRSDVPLAIVLSALDWESRLSLVLAGPLDDEALSTALAALASAPALPDRETALTAAGLDLLSTAELPLHPFATLAGDLQAMGAPLAARHPGLADAAAVRAATDPLANLAFTPALDDRDWLALADICATTRPLKG